MQPVDTELFGTVHRAKKINSKVKGNKNELILTKILTDWVGTEFTRVPMSGGLRWANRMDICGDVINTNPKFDFPFSVETKHIANLGLKLSHPELRKNSVVYTHFEQCKRDAEAAGKIPFLIIRQNGMRAGCYYIFLSLKLSRLMKMANYIKPVFEGDLIGFKSEDFFKLVSFETLKWIYDRKSSGSK
jgi:hypothetical protein